MKKNILNKIKLFFSLMMIICLLIPTYASLSASDGSAFVTKAEFDSVLADFNSRLSTFEAGINSKIDSQVTAYLDRNGIWNGKEQKLENKGEFTKSFFEASGLKQGSVTSYFHDSGGTAYQDFSSRTYDDYLVISNGTINKECNMGVLINDIGKSGLLNVVGTYGDGVTHTISLVRTNNDYGADGCFTLKYTWKLVRESGGVFSDQWAKTWQWENNFVTGYWYNRNVVYGVIPKSPLFAYIFVSKHDRIYVHVKIDILAKSATIDGRDLPIVMKVKNAKVY